MTHQQALAFGLVIVTIGLFVWGRFRYDLVSLGVLVASVALGVTPAKKAFDGFSSDVIVIIACALVVSAGFARSGVIERLLRPIAPRLKSVYAQVPVFVAATAILSMATKNVGALAILMPIAIQTARRTGTSPASLLMPMSFASLLGGLVTLVGTSPNIIVSQVRQEVLGRPFGMYDFAPVGLSLTAVGIVFLSLAWRLLPSHRVALATMDTALASKPYVTEVTVPGDWNSEKRRVGDLLGLAAGDVKVVALIRGGQRKTQPHPNLHIRPGDRLLLEGEQEALEQLIARRRLRLVRADKPIATEERSEDVRVVEAVIEQGSPLLGKSARRLNLHGEHGVNLLAVSRAGYRLSQTLRAIRFRLGDLVLLQGAERSLPGALKTLGLLPLAERQVRLGDLRRVAAPVAILAAAMLAIAFHLAPVAIAFFAAAVAMVAFGGLRMREAYAALDGPVLVLIGALIPLGEAIHATGGADLAAGWLARLMAGAPPVATLAAMMLLAMLAAPFMHNAPTVLVFGPIAVGLAQRLHLNPDAFLMAVATGAASDFLTPIGHQCNTLVMAPGGYRFWDYPRLGAPLSLAVLAAGTLLIAFFWGLTG